MAALAGGAPARLECCLRLGQARRSRPGPGGLTVSAPRFFRAVSSRMSGAKPRWPPVVEVYGEPWGAARCVLGKRKLAVTERGRDSGERILELTQQNPGFWGTRVVMSQPLRPWPSSDSQCGRLWRPVTPPSPPPLDVRSPSTRFTGVHWCGRLHRLLALNERTVAAAVTS